VLVEPRKILFLPLSVHPFSLVNATATKDLAIGVSRRKYWKNPICGPLFWRDAFVGRPKPIRERQFRDGRRLLHKWFRELHGTSDEAARFRRHRTHADETRDGVGKPVDCCARVVR
jgi:hypothetical protein